MIRDHRQLSPKKHFYRDDRIFFREASNRQSNVAPSLLFYKKKNVRFQRISPGQESLPQSWFKLFDLSSSIWTDSFWHEVAFAVPLHRNFKCLKFSRSDYSWNIRGFREYEKSWYIFWYIFWKRLFCRFFENLFFVYLTCRIDVFYIQIYSFRIFILLR